MCGTLSCGCLPVTTGSACSSSLFPRIAGIQKWPAVLHFIERREPSNSSVRGATSLDFRLFGDFTIHIAEPRADFCESCFLGKERCQLSVVETGSHSETSRKGNLFR